VGWSSSCEDRSSTSSAGKIPPFVERISPSPSRSPLQVSQPRSSLSSSPFEGPKELPPGSPFSLMTLYLSLFEPGRSSPRSRERSGGHGSFLSGELWPQPFPAEHLFPPGGGRPPLDVPAPSILAEKSRLFFVMDLSFPSRDLPLFYRQRPPPGDSTRQALEASQRNRQAPFPFSLVNGFLFFSRQSSLLDVLLKYGVVNDVPEQLPFFSCESNFPPWLKTIFYHRPLAPSLAGTPPETAPPFVCKPPFTNG